MVSDVADRRKGGVMPHGNPKVAGNHFIVNEGSPQKQGLVQSHSTSQLQEVSVPIV